MTRRRPSSNITSRPGYGQAASALRSPTRISAAVLAFAIGISVLLPAGRHQWALSLFQQPTRYTALSFNRPWALPATAVVNKPVSVSFTISNHERRTVDYRYVLSASNGRNSRVLGGAGKSLAAGANWTVSAVVRPTCGGSSCRVEVSLPGHPETIDFLVTLKAQRGKHV